MTIMCECCTTDLCESYMILCVIVLYKPYETYFNHFAIFIFPEVGSMKSDKMGDYYEILGIQRNATEAEIKKG